MARLPRLAIAGELHHLMQRGLAGEAIVRDDQDRGALLSLLRESARQEQVAVHAYALLDTELHLLATPTEAAALGRLMQAIGRRYVAAFNRRHARRGSLWEGRFRTSVVDPRRLVDAMLYVELLPLRAHALTSAVDWTWSSAAAHVGRTRDPVLTDHPAYWALGNTPFEREHAHARLLDHGLAAEMTSQFAQAVWSGLAVGGNDFVARIAEQAARPVQRRPRGRPRKTASATDRDEGMD